MNATIRRTVLLSAPVLALLALVLVRWLAKNADPPASEAPIFKKFTSPPVIGPYDFYRDAFRSPRFSRQGDKISIMTWGKPYVYDLSQHRLLGEVIQGYPLYLSPDQTHMLCAQRFARRDVNVLPEAIRRFLGIKESAVFGDLKYWLLDLNTGSASYVGEIGQTEDWDSPSYPSPNFQYSFIKRFAGLSDSEFILYDLGQRRIVTKKFDGWPTEWWDNTHIIFFIIKTGDLLLYDVTNGQVTPFIKRSKINSFLQSESLPSPPPFFNFFCEWNGTNDDFYLTDLVKRAQATNAFLAKLDRATTNLTLLDRDFHFGRLGHFNETQTLYVYCGHESNANHDNVFLRNLATGQTRQLVTATTNLESSSPYFYRNNIIYERTNTIWMIDTNGSHATRLFPP